MNIARLRIGRAARPFRPFEIRTGSDEAYMITHPQIIALAPDGLTAVVFPGPARVHLIDVASITEMTTFPTASKVGTDDEPDRTV